MSHTHTLTQTAAHLERLDEGRGIRTLRVEQQPEGEPHKLKRRCEEEERSPVAQQCHERRERLRPRVRGDAEECAAEILDFGR